MERVDVPRGTLPRATPEVPLNTLRAALRAQLWLRLRALSTWGFWVTGVLLTAWGCVLDVLAVGLEARRPLHIALGSGSVVALLLGAWIGCGVPERYSLREYGSAWTALPDSPWALPAARCGVAAACGATASMLCVLYTSVFAHYFAWPGLGQAICGGMVTSLLASAWAGVLAPRLGALGAVGVVLACAVVASQGGAPGSLGFLVPTVRSCAVPDAWSVLAALSAAIGLVALTPAGFRSDGGD